MPISSSMPQFTNELYMTRKEPSILLCSVKFSFLFQYQQHCTLGDFLGMCVSDYANWTGYQQGTTLNKDNNDTYDQAGKLLTRVNRCPSTQTDRIQVSSFPQKDKWWGNVLFHGIFIFHCQLIRKRGLFPRQDVPFTIDLSKSCFSRGSCSFHIQLIREKDVLFPMFFSTETLWKQGYICAYESKRHHKPGKHFHTLLPSTIFFF